MSELDRAAQDRREDVRNIAIVIAYHGLVVALVLYGVLAEGEPLIAFVQESGNTGIVLLTCLAFMIGSVLSTWLTFVRTLRRRADRAQREGSNAE
jgi:hypothetical protein